MSMKAGVAHSSSLVNPRRPRPNRSNFVAGTNFYDKYRENCEAQMSRAPYHKVVMMDKARHFIMYDDPDGMYAQMEEFLTPP